MWSSIWLCLVAGLPLASSAVAEPASSALTPYGDASSAAEWGQYDCLTSGVAVSGFGRKQYAHTPTNLSYSPLLPHFFGLKPRDLFLCVPRFCVDVPPADGQKLVVTVDAAPPPLEAVRIGRNTYLRPSNLSQSVTTTTAVGPIIEVASATRAVRPVRVHRLRRAVRVRLQCFGPAAAGDLGRPHRRRA